MPGPADAPCLACTWLGAENDTDILCTEYVLNSFLATFWPLFGHFWEARERSRSPQADEGMGGRTAIIRVSPATGYSWFAA